MGFIDLFGGDKVSGTKALVRAIGSQFNDLAREDADIYRYYFPCPKSGTRGTQRPSLRTTAWLQFEAEG